MARFLLSRRKVLEQYSIVKGCTDYVSYSFKTNPEVGQVLESSTDCFFSISARAHLERIADKGRVIFFAQGWSESEISELLDAGVKRFTVDNIQDLETLKRFMKGKNVKVWLFLRMKLKENTIHTGKYFVFGMGAEEIKSAIRDLADACWIERLGLHFHRKTQNTSEWSLKEEIVESLGEEVLGRISIVNMGGGLPSIYKNSRPEIESIMKRISEFAKWLRSRGIQLIIEPGRFIAAPAV
ncbi:MAG: decarboxylase, partial [Candidatus Micrarchaeia archaeon]